MNINSLKRFAKDARIKLLDQVGRKMEFMLTHDTAELRGKENEINQLKSEIKEHGKEQVIETVAYTWFNRLMALRFMDANGYTIPKVVTPLPGMTNPEILQNALAGNIEADLKFDRQRLNDLLDGKTAVTDAHREAYKMLLVASCNQWHAVMPFMFERISDYTEMLLPDDLLSDYSIVSDIRNGMSDEDCQQEELIGWLYQFYISDRKDDVFEGLKKNIRITPENIPAATQLFTPRWIVRYMVENTLGKLWLTLKPHSKLKEFMPYYIEAPSGNASAALPEGIKGITDITFLDPCQGSGHVLVYAFDLFTRIYEEEGYNTSEIPALILQHNLFGIDIDERAAQLAAFALTMKARSYYSRFLRKPVQPHVIVLENVNEDIIKHAVNLPLDINGKLISDCRNLTLFNLTQADNYGSLIQIDQEEAGSITIQEGSIWQSKELKLKEQAEYLGRQYHCVVTNPPYMGSKGMNNSLKEFVEQKFAEDKGDLMTCFMRRCYSFSMQDGYLGMINLPSWMFLGSFEATRHFILENTQVNSLLQLGRGIFGSDFGSVAFVIQKAIPTEKSTGIYRRLFTEHVQVRSSEVIRNIFLDKKTGLFYFRQFNFKLITGSPLGYWLGENTLERLRNSKALIEFGQATKGLDTCDNNRFVRYWYEIDINRYSDKKSLAHKWFTYYKGGDFQKWFGNNDKVVNWEMDGSEIRNFRNPDGSIKSRPQNIQRYFQTGITWSSIGSGTTSYRIMSNGIFGGGGNGFFPDSAYLNNFLGFLNSKVSKYFKDLFNPTLNNLSGDLHKLPVSDFIENGNLNNAVVECIEITRTYAALEEVNIGFTAPLIGKNTGISLNEIFDANAQQWERDFIKLQKNETLINSILIELYGLQNELTPDVPLEEITILQEETRIVDGRICFDPLPVFLQLLSYSVGCLFGRYALDKDGLIMAKAGETLKDFIKKFPNPAFTPDEDNIIPVLDGEWFTDDIVGRFKVFLEAAFGESHFNENLRYLEEAIGKDIRKYFVKDFYNDHIKRYKKRPIYWMFSSPKGHFKALIYMHRYRPDLCSKMLNDYLLPFIGKLEAKKQTETRLSLREDVSAREKAVAVKEIDKLDTMIKDCQHYEKTLFRVATQKIAIDLDDGVMVNYQKFKDVLMPIKGLEKEED